MPNNRSSRGRRRRRPVRSQQGRQVHNDLRELITVTRNQFLPSRRDKNPLPTPARDHIYTFRRACSLGAISVGSSGAGAGIPFHLTDVPNSTDFTSLFDQYRFVEVRIKFVPTTGNFGPSTSSTDFPKLMTVIDYDDATTPLNEDEMRQYETYQVTPNTQAVERVIQPPLAALASYSGAFTSYAQAPRTMWFDCASAGIEFYGLKWYVPPISVVSGSYVLWTMEATYTLQFRRPR